MIAQMLQQAFQPFLRDPARLLARMQSPNRSAITKPMNIAARDMGFWARRHGRRI